jgi:hypothetical protein
MTTWINVKRMTRRLKKRYRKGVDKRKRVAKVANQNRA